MNKLFVLILAASVWLYSCGKDNKSTTDTDTKKQVTPTNTNKTTQQQQNKSGSAAPDFTFTEDGKEKKLSDYKGKVVLVNFWATWCGPCRRELPSLSDISTELKGKDFKLIGVSVDEQKNDVDNFLKSSPVSYTVLHKPDKLINSFMQAGNQYENVIPQTYIVDKDGNIVETIIGGRSKEEFLKIINKYL